MAHSEHIVQALVVQRLELEQICVNALCGDIIKAGLRYKRAIVIVLICLVFQQEVNCFYLEGFP